jgi:hypothetical protein
MNDNQIKKPEVKTINTTEKSEAKQIVQKIIELVRVKHLQP